MDKQIVDVVGYGPIEFPSGMSQSEISEALKKLPNLGVPEKAQKANEAFAEAAKPKEASLGEKALATGAAALTGLAAPMAGAAEYLGIKRPAQLIKEVSDTTGQIAPVAAPVAEFAGSVLSPMPTKVGNVAARLLPKAQTLGRMATQGAVGAAFNPLGTAEDKDYLDFLAKKAGEIGTGGVLGGAFGKLGQTIINPKVSEKMQMLKDMGMKYFTPGQLASQIPYFGNFAQKTEEALTSTPLIGSIIEYGKSLAREDFNKAMGNQVLKPLGESLPKNVNAGHEMINYIYDKINNIYKGLENKIHFGNKIDPTNGSNTITRMTNSADSVTKNLVPEARQNVNEALKHTFYDPLIGPQGTYSLNGKEFRTIESSLGEQAKTWISSKNPVTRSQGFALRDFQEDLRKELALQNPVVGKELLNAHESFKRFLRVEKAAAFRAADEGVFSANQMRSAAESMAGRRATARGTGMSIKEAQSASNVLGKGLPNSGTADRILTPAGLKALLNLGDIASNVITFGSPTFATLGVYNRPVMGALTTLATGRRPEMIRNIEPVISGGIARGTGLSVD